MDPQVNIKFDILSPKHIDAAVNAKYKSELFSDRIWANKAGMIDKLQSSIINAMKGDVTIDKIGRQIRDTFNVTAYESQRLVNTETARVQTQASEDIGRAAGVEQVMWSATLDNLTNPEDAALDGKVWGINEDHPEPPLHPLCRCCLINVPYEGWTPTQRKDNETGGLIDNTTYKDWKQNQGIDKVQTKAINKVSDLTNEELKVIEGYKQFGYAINETIRKRPGMRIDESAIPYANSLKEIMNKAKLAEELQVYRGVGTQALVPNKNLRNLVIHDPSRMIGTEISDSAFMSTSASKDVARRFIPTDRGTYGDTVLLEIRVPKGYNALEFGDFSLNHEEEVLLKHGSKIKITGFEDTRKHGTPKMIEVDDTTKPIGNIFGDDIFGMDYKKKWVESGERIPGYIKYICEVVK